MARPIAINQTDPRNARYKLLVCTLRGLGAHSDVQSVREIFAFRTPDAPMGRAPN